MTTELAEVLLLDRHHALSLPELAELSGLAEAELDELVDYGVIVPLDPGAAHRVFHARCIVAARTACRLRDDFELDSRGLALALTLLERVHDLEAQLTSLRAQLPRRKA
jgi:chaperone modulatory protein CbpM